MQNEKDQSTEGIQIHDILVVTKNQKTKEDGSKRGYSWGLIEMGVVVEVSPTSVVIKKANGETNAYDTKEDDGDYFYTYGKGSEIEYQNKIDAEIEKAVESRKDAEKKVKALMEWRHDFEFSVSVLGRMARFIKAFK